MKTRLPSPAYPAFLAELKGPLLGARITAARAINREILLYWDLGRRIVETQLALGWGESVIDRLSCDLQPMFPRTSGYFPRNLRSMKSFYLSYAEESIWQQPVAKFKGRLPTARQLAAAVRDVMPPEK